MLLTATYPNVREDFAAWTVIANTIEEPDPSESGGGRRETPAAATAAIATAAASGDDDSRQEDQFARQERQQVSAVAARHDHEHDGGAAPIDDAAADGHLLAQQDRHLPHHLSEHLAEHHHHPQDRHLSADASSIWTAQRASPNLNTVSTEEAGSRRAAGARHVRRAPRAPRVPPPPVGVATTGATGASSASTDSPFDAIHMSQHHDNRAVGAASDDEGDDDGVIDEIHQELTTKDAHWLLDAVESYHRSQLTPTELDVLERSGLREKAKHRNAILFHDDLMFILRGTQRLIFDPVAFSRSSTCNNNRRIFLLHEAAKIVLRAYRVSRENAPPKSCIWSALMHRLQYFMDKSMPGVRIEEHVEGVRHKEATLFVDDYHISRSNFTKLARQLLRREAAEAASAGSPATPPLPPAARTPQAEGGTGGRSGARRRQEAPDETVDVESKTQPAPAGPPSSLRNQHRFGSTGASSMSSSISSSTSSSSSSSSSASKVSTKSSPAAPPPPPLPLSPALSPPSPSKKRPASAIASYSAKSPRPLSSESVRRRHSPRATMRDRRGSAPPDYHSAQAGAASASFSRESSLASFGEPAQAVTPESTMPRAASHGLMHEDFFDDEHDLDHHLESQHHRHQQLHQQQHHRHHGMQHEQHLSHLLHHHHGQNLEHHGPQAPATHDEDKAGGAAEPASLHMDSRAETDRSKPPSSPGTEDSGAMHHAGVPLSPKNNTGLTHSSSQAPHGPGPAHHRQHLHGGGGGGQQRHHSRHHQE